MEMEIELLEVQPSMMRSLRSQVSRNKRPIAFRLVKQLLFATSINSTFVYQQNLARRQRRNIRSSQVATIGVGKGGGGKESPAPPPLDFYR